MRTKALHIIILLAATIICSTTPARAEHLIVIATNDTHSQIEPNASDNLGGVFRRRAFFDYMRANNKNVLIVDAGDAVQGTTLYNLYKGEVEYSLLDSLNYDISILGNHDFDNGIDELAKHYKNTKVTKLSANYDFTGTAMEGVMKPYVIKEFAGKRVGFFGININPEGLINPTDYNGMEFSSCESVADSIAKYLKEIEKVDFTVMLSHIGYESWQNNEDSDCGIASKSHYIDLIIGAYSHTNLSPNDPRTKVKNANGKIVTIGQNGRNGKYIGVYDIDLDNFTVKYDQVAMDTRWDSQAHYPAMNSWLNKYRVNIKCQELMPIGYFSDYFKARDDYANWLINAQLEIAKKYFGIEDVTISIFSSACIRQDLPKGFLTWSRLKTAFPFDNKYVIIEVDGNKLKEIIENINNNNARHNYILINQSPITQDINNIDNKKKYRIITIDYLANGGDFMIPTNDYIIYTDNIRNGERLIDYFISKTIANEIVNAH